LIYIIVCRAYKEHTSTYTFSISSFKGNEEKKEERKREIESEEKGRPFSGAIKKG
jgi:hypothetical protein